MQQYQRHRYVSKLFSGRSLPVLFSFSIHIACTSNLQSECSPFHFGIWRCLHATSRNQEFCFLLKGTNRTLGVPDSFRRCRINNQSSSIPMKTNISTEMQLTPKLVKDHNKRMFFALLSNRNQSNELA